MKVDIWHGDEIDIVSVEKYKNKILSIILNLYDSIIGYNYDKSNLLNFINSFDNEFYIELKNHNKEALYVLINRFNLISSFDNIDLCKKIKEIW